MIQYRWPVKVVLLVAVAACVSSSSTAPPPQTGPSAAALAQGRLQLPLEKLTRTDGGPPAIVPDDMTRHLMAEANVVKVSGLFLVCLDAAGAVDQYIELINSYPEDESLTREAAGACHAAPASLRIALRATLPAT